MQVAGFEKEQINPIQTTVSRSNKETSPVSSKTRSICYPRLTVTVLDS